MRLLINGRFLRATPSAVNSVALELSLALGRTGRDVSLVVPPLLEDKARDTGLPVVVHGKRKGILWEQLELPALRDQGVIAGFFNTVPLRGTGYVTLLHDAQVFIAPDSYGWASRSWRQLLSRRAAAPGNHILTVSNYAKQSLMNIGLGADERIGVVHNGLGNVGDVAPDTGILSRIGDKPFCIGLASTMPHKNIGLLLRAFADPMMQDLTLVLFGNATRGDFAEAGHVVPHNVICAGFVSDGELAALYDHAVSVLVPSLEEGFGLPALEGMARGTVTMVADRAALPEVVGDAGIVLPSDDPGAWIKAIHALMADPDSEDALSAAGRRRAAGFTWDAAAATACAHLDRWFPAERG